MYDANNDPCRSFIITAHDSKSFMSVLRLALSAAAIITVLSPLAAVAGRTAAENEVRLGNEAYFDADYLAAEERFTEAILEDSAWAIPYNNRGLAHCRQSLFSAAEIDFDSAKLRNPSYAAPYLNQGKCLAAQRRFSEAAVELQAGLAIDPDNIKLMYNLGWVRDELEEYDEAIALYQAALVIDPDYAKALAALAITLAKSGDTNRAVNTFYRRVNAGLSADPFTAGDLSLTLAAAESALPMCAGSQPAAPVPEDRNVCAMPEIDLLTKETTDQGDLQTAISAYNLQLLRGSGLDFSSDVAADHYRDGIFNLSTGRYDLAVQDFEDAQTLEPDVADIPWLLGWTQLFRRNEAAALQGINDARFLMPALNIDSSSATSDVFIDGIYRGETPAIVAVFPSRFDATLRSESGGNRQERTVVAYADNTPGGRSPMIVTTNAVSGFSDFQEEVDVDRDWLGDIWETTHFGNLAARPGEDPDGDGKDNLEEYWDGTLPRSGLCLDGPSNLCLNGSRFSVTISWRDFDGNTGLGRVVPVAAEDSGLFWFFSEANWEMLVKVLRGCAINGYYWVFAAATTNVEYTLGVTDLVTGATKSYFNPLGNSADSITDIEAFASCSESTTPAGPATELNSPIVDVVPPVLAFTKQDCTPDTANLCLNEGRFNVEVEWRDFDGVRGSGTVVPFGSADSGLFYFFSPNNWEMLVKVLRGCAINDHYWVFAAATTNVEYTLTVTDTDNGAVSIYENPLGRASPAITDTGAFATCP